MGPTYQQMHTLIGLSVATVILLILLLLIVIAILVKRDYQQFQAREQLRPEDMAKLAEEAKAEASGIADTDMRERIEKAVLDEIMRERRRARRAAMK